MSLSIQLRSIKCLNESSEASASDEYYVLGTVAALRPLIPGVPAVPNFRVFRYGVFEDMDDDDPHPAVVNGPPLWGLDGAPVKIQDPSDVGIVISVLENDNGVPEQYQELVNVRAGLSLAASAGSPTPAARASRLTTDILNVLNGIDLPIPMALDDDHIGTQQLVLDPSDLAGTRDKVLRFSGDGAEVELTFRIHNQREGDWSGVNDNWRSIGGFFPPGAPISVTSRRPGNLDLFVTGGDGRVYTSWWYEGSDWSGVNNNWRNIGGIFPVGAPVTAVAKSPNSIDLFIIGNDGRVYTSWWYEGSDWSGVNDNWRSIGGVFPAGRKATAIARAPTNLDVFICGGDGKVYTSWWSD